MSNESHRPIFKDGDCNIWLMQFSYAYLVDWFGNLFEVDQQKEKIEKIKSE